MRQRFLVSYLPPARPPKRLASHASIWDRSVMSVRSARRTYLLGSSALLALIALSDAAIAQTKLPEVEVTANKNKPKPRPATVARPAAPATVAPLSPAEQVAAKNNAFDQSRSNLYTTIGTTSSTQTHATIDALPQGTNTT